MPSARPRARTTLAILLAASTSSLPAAASGSAVEFDGTTDYVEFGTMDPGTSFTVEAWLVVDDYESYGYSTVFEAVDRSDATNSFYVGYVGSGWQVEINDTDSTEGSTCGSRSTQTLLRPAIAAASEVVPVPPKGSSTRSP